MCSFDINYIGETSRTIGSQSKEHLTMSKQTVYKHIASHIGASNKPKCTDISWKTIHKNIKHQDKRKCIEAFKIKRLTNQIMNGCIGRTINV